MYDDLVKRLRDAAKMSEALAVLLPHSEGNTTAKLYNAAADAIEQLTDISAEEEKTKESLCLNCQSKTCWNEGFDTGVHNCKAYSPYQSDTNYSRIRSLSIYEMADELQVLIDEAVWSGEGKSNNELLEWLQSPTVEDE